MGIAPNTSPAQTEALVDALEALLDIFLDGRMEDLDEREQEVVATADAAIAAVSTASD